jgi:hypothetical protein
MSDVNEDMQSFMEEQRRKQSVPDEDSFYVILLAVNNIALGRRVVGYLTSAFVDDDGLPDMSDDARHDALQYTSAEDARSDAELLYSKYRTIEGWVVYCVEESTTVTFHQHTFQE